MPIHTECTRLYRDLQWLSYEWMDESINQSMTKLIRLCVFVWYLVSHRSLTIAGIGEDNPSACHCSSIRWKQEQWEGVLAGHQGWQEARVHSCQRQTQAWHLNKSLQKRKKEKNSQNYFIYLQTGFQRHEGSSGHKERGIRWGNVTIKYC